MWRRLPIFVKTQILVLAVPALAVSLSMEAQGVQRQQAAATRAEAVRTAVAATVAREEAKAIRAALDERDRAQARADAAEAALQERTAERDQLQEKVKALEAASVGLGSGPVAVSRSAGPNHFPYGWCTWWVAHKRYVPWNGNAISWLTGARAYGYAIGSMPRPGAIMVTNEDPLGRGHVAFVESVGGSSFTVSEMNYSGWGTVDWRTVVLGRVPVLGFIY